MKTYFKTGILLITCLLGCALPAAAQKMTKVTGIVYNIAGRKKIPFSDIAVQVYAAKTVAEGKDIKKALDSDPNDPDRLIMFHLDKNAKTTTDNNGYYEIMVPDNGALIFKAGLSTAVFKEVDHRMKIDVEINDGLHLSEVTVTGIRTEMAPEPQAPIMFGNQYIPYTTFNIPSHTGNRYSRLIIQPYVVDCMLNDTVVLPRPLVYDGKEYAMTQLRKKGYDMSRDPLNPYIIKDQYLSSDPMTIHWRDTVVVPDATHSYNCYATISIEDYSAITYRTYEVNTCKAKRPLKFLQYNMLYQTMDPMDYKERPQIQKRNTSDKILLTFEINSDKLVQNEENKRSLDMLRNRLKEIAESPGAILKEFHVTGTSSPDGNYYSNLALAERRMKRIESEITSILPRQILERVYRNPQATVAPWSDIVTLLERDGKTGEAAQVKEVLARYKDVNQQGIALKKLPFYKSVITTYLEELRKVNYNCIYEIYREPNDEEIMALYKKEGADGTYTRYEYWRLFMLLKDREQLKAIYRKAYETSLAERGKPWALAANNLAVMCLEDGISDTEILDPLIDRAIYTTDYKRTSDDNQRVEIINPSPIVNNQLCMYVNKGDFTNASILAKMLPEDEKYDMLKAYAWAIGGYFRGGATPEEKARAEKTFNTIKNSSPQNAVVMYLALESPEGDAEALKQIELLPQEDALTWYFKAVISARKGDLSINDTAFMLSECFKRDKKFISIAQNDGEFDDDTVEIALDLYN